MGLQLRWHVHLSTGESIGHAEANSPVVIMLKNAPLQNTNIAEEGTSLWTDLYVSS